MSGQDGVGRGHIGTRDVGQRLKLACGSCGCGVSTYKAGDALIRSISRDQTASSANAFVYGLYPPVTSTFLDSK